MNNLSKIRDVLKGKIEFRHLSSANFKDTSSRGINVKSYKGKKITINEYVYMMSVEIKIESEFSFSINNPDLVMLIREPLIISNFPYKLYIPNKNGNPFSILAFKDFWEIFKLKIEDIQLDSDESIFFLRNKLKLALKASRNLIPIIDDIISVINENENIFQRGRVQRIFAKNIPSNLLPLLPLLKKWAVADDAERDELIENASEQQKKRLVKTVDPFFMSINAFLDSFGNRPLSYEATLIGNLAELVTELKQSK